MAKRTLIQSLVELSKVRIMSLVLVTTAIGYFLPTQSIDSYLKFFCCLLGSALSCAGASALNQYLERDIDPLMTRTKNRPLPQGDIAPLTALIFGVSTVLGGVLFLIFTVNLLTGFLSLLTAFLYVLVYTPMKRVTWWNTFVGAIPGAIPPMGGVAASTGELGIVAWVLFAILFVWQHPHFYAIAWMCKDDYAKANLKMLPVVAPDGGSTFLQLSLYSFLLVPISLLPTALGLSGKIYFFGMLALGIWFLWLSLVASSSKTIADARRVLLGSVLYLPIQLLLIITDTGF